MKLSWEIVDANIRFVVETNSERWVGFGFGKDMLPADIMLFRHDSESGDWICQDSYSKDLAVPQPDTAYGGTNDAQSFSVLTSKTYTHSFTVTRAKNTGDSHDVAITDMDMPMIFAAGSSITPGYHGALSRAHAVVNFVTGAVTVPDSTTKRLFKLNIFHGVTMYAGFGFIYPVGIYIARYWKNGGSWVAYHAVLMTAVTTEPSWALSGVLATSGHRTLDSWTFLDLFGYNCDLAGKGYLGVTDISRGTTVGWLRWLYILSVAVTPLTLLLLAWRNNHQAKVNEANGDNSKSTCKQNDTLPKFDWHEVHDRVEAGEKLFVVKNIVYDATPFLQKHPGGSKLLSNVVGLDATYVFYGRRPVKGAKGGKRKENEAASPIYHAHSRLAMSLLLKLAVAVLVSVRNDFNDNDDTDAEEVDTNNILKSSVMLDHSDVEASAGAKGIGQQLRGISRDHLQKTSFKPRTVTTALSELAFREYEVATRTCASSTESRRPTFKISFDLHQAANLGDTSRAQPVGRKTNLAQLDMSPAEVFIVPGQCVIVQYITDQGEVVTRQYTPYKSRNVGTIDLYIKMTDGMMTRHLRECKSLRTRGPIQHAPDALNPARRNGCWGSIGMIAGGSGLTPMLLIIDYHLRFAPRGPGSVRPNLSMALLNINHSDVDVFAQEDLKIAEQRSQGTLTITNLYHNLVGPGTYKGQVGRVTADLLKKVLPSSSTTAASGPAATALSPTMVGDKITRIQSLQMAAGSDGGKGMGRKRTSGSGSGTSEMGFAASHRSSVALLPKTQQQSPAAQRNMGYSEVNQNVSKAFIDSPLVSGASSPGSSSPAPKHNYARRAFERLLPETGSETEDSSDDNNEPAKKATAIFVCGPPPMQAAVLELLLSLNYAPESIIIL
ncbi:hypothetical protein DFJ77DRAFT_533726 [Powellomyces hirtus]|nr:hypothetical protein DFJ77DRAFT_533726 [Powellomyces hirtus]